MVLIMSASFLASWVPGMYLQARHMVRIMNFPVSSSTKMKLISMPMKPRPARDVHKSAERPTKRKPLKRALAAAILAFMFAFVILYTTERMNLT